MKVEEAENLLEVGDWMSKVSCFREGEDGARRRDRGREK